MANVVINDTNLTNIANAIREKNGTTNTYKPSEMADAIAAISSSPGGGSGSYSNVDMIRLPLTYKIASGTTFSSWKSTMESANIPLSLDLTAYGIKEDWSNFGSLTFGFAFYYYPNEANERGSAILYKDDDGMLKLEVNLADTSILYKNNTTFNNISFTPDWGYTDATITNKKPDGTEAPATWVINPADFPANNVSFYSRYHSGKASSYIQTYGSCIAFHGGYLTKLI